MILLYRGIRWSCYTKLYDDLVIPRYMTILLYHAIWLSCYTPVYDDIVISEYMLILLYRGIWWSCYISSCFMLKLKYPAFYILYWRHSWAVVKRPTKNYWFIRCLSNMIRFISHNLYWFAVSSVSVSLYFVAVRTILLSRHGSNLARHVIIHDIIHSLMYMPSTPHCGFSGVSPDKNCAYVHWGSFTSNSKSDRRAIWFTWSSEPHDTTSLHNVLVYKASGSPRRSPIQLWTGRDVA